MHSGIRRWPPITRRWMQITLSGSVFMNMVIKKHAQEIDMLASQMIAEYVNKNPNRILVFPTGNTPLGLYKNLAGRVACHEVSFQNTYLVELDEYMGIAENDPRNLFKWLQRAFLDQVDFQDMRMYRFQADAADIEAETNRMDRVINDLGGIGLLVLGLGPNGHLGFNEPGSPFDAPTRAITLTPASIQSSAGYWGSSQTVPSMGLTLGMQALSLAQQTLLMVSGQHKAEILRQVINGEISPEIPATLLRTMQNVTILADADAASLL
jgi:glucosamine-6-phosphate deaminase